MSQYGTYEETPLTGSTNILSVACPYLSRLHMHVFINEVEVPQGSLIFTDPTHVQLPLAAGEYAGKTALVRRITPISAPVTTFTPNGISYQELNRQVTQFLYVLQERRDAEGKLQTRVDNLEAKVASLEGALEAINASIGAGAGLFAAYLISLPTELPDLPNVVWLDGRLVAVS